MLSLLELLLSDHIGKGLNRDGLAACMLLCLGITAIPSSWVKLQQGWTLAVRMSSLSIARSRLADMGESLPMITVREEQIT